jgi:hypothetical protein
MIFEMNKWKLLQGQDEQIPVFLLAADGSPVSIAGATEVHLQTVNQDGSKLEKQAATGWTVGFISPLYVYSFNFSAAEVAALPIGVLTVIIKILFGTTYTRYLTYTNSLTVSKLPF